MSTATIRTAIYNVVNGVSGTGNVYDRRRWAVEYDDVLDMFVDDTAGTILGFDIEAGPVSQERAEFGDARVFRTQLFRIRMYYGATDADSTEKAAATLFESVIDALDNDTTLHGSFHYAELAQGTVLELRTFAGNLIHYGEIEQRVKEYTT